MIGFVILCTDGDSGHIALVNKETFDWFTDRGSFSPTTNHPPEAQIVANMTNNECDREEAIEYLMCDPASGSFSNDIALMLASDEFNGETFTGDGISELFAFCTKHRIEIAGDFLGVIY